MILFFSFCIIQLRSHETPLPAIIMTVLPVSSLALSLYCTLVVCIFYSSQNNFVDVWAVFKDAAAAALLQIKR